MRDKTREISSVIYVCVSEQYRIDRARIEGRLLPIALAQLLQALKHPTVD
jgi:hypothetical protein